MRDRVNAETPKTGPGGEARVDVHVNRKSVWAGRRRKARAFDTAPWNVPMNLRDVVARGELHAELID